MGAKATNEGILNGDVLEDAVNLLGEPGGRTTVGTRTEHAFARNAAIGHASALWIYLRHRGVLNVEEFRRTRARGS